jgi:hypothetical protein
MAITEVCGWECRIAVVGAAASPSANHWHTANNTPTISTSTVRTGTAALRINAAATTQYLARTIARTVVSGRVYFRYVDGPATEVGIITFINASGNSSIRMTAANELRVQAGAGTAVTFTSALTANTWYRIDFLLDCSTGTASMKARLDGGTEQESTVAQASANNTSVRYGANGAQTMEFFFDDMVMGDATGDYPFGPGQVERMKPDSDGTHNIAADPNEQFGFDAAGADLSNATTTAWQSVDDDDLTSLSDFIRQDITGAAAYVEVNFAAAPFAHDALAVNVVSSWHASATGANTVGLHIIDGGTDAVVTDDAGDDLSDFSNTTVTFDSKVYATAPSGGVWTEAKLSALKARMGYSTDVIGQPYWDGIMLEVAYGDLRVPRFTAYPQLLAH